MRSHMLIGFVLLLSLSAAVMSQEYVCDTTYTIETVTDTTYVPRLVKHFSVPVTYYDYHVDGSNPDFGFRVTSRWDQTGLSYDNYSGWVDSTLDSNKVPKRHPALADTFLDISWNIGRLFEPWDSGATDTFLLKFEPLIKDTTIEDTLIIKPDSAYDFDGDSMRYWVDTQTWYQRWDTIPVPDTLLINDTMFKNIEIKDSLVAYWIENELTYDDTTDSMWSFGDRSEKLDPLGDRGFGLEDSNSTKNDGYTFCLRNKFTYKGGEEIYFGGDDDAYLFINGNLAIECGGFHEVMLITLPLDSFRLPGGVALTVGEKYDIDIFFVERRQGGNWFIGGLSDFDFRDSVQVDTVKDIKESYRPDTVKTLIKCVGVDPRSGKALFQRRTLLGLTIPPLAEQVAFEYFTLSGAKVMEKRMTLTRALADKTPGLPGGMYVIRINFLNAQGKSISRSTLRSMTMGK